MDNARNIGSLTKLTVLSVLAAYLSFGWAGFPNHIESDIVSEVKSLLPVIASYDYGDSREPLSALSVLVSASIDSRDTKLQIEQEMITFLGSGATFAGKQFVCEQLSIIGTEKSVPVLTELLSEDQTSDIALFAMQRIPGPEVDTALRESLPNVSRDAAIGIINSLGERKTVKAVGALDKLISDTDPQIARSAVVALGKIADKNAEKVLKRARSETKDDLRALVLDAYLRCADNLFANGKSAQAASIYEELYADDDIARIRMAALRGRVQSDIENAAGIILSVLNRDNRELQSVAIGLVRELPGTLDLSGIFAELPNLSDQAQIQLLSAIAFRKETSARRVVLDATKHNDEAVRAAALSALAKIGNESDIGLLMRFAVSGEPVSDREAARASLDFLPGASVNKTIIAKIPMADPLAKAEYVRTLGERKAMEAIRTLLNTAVDSDENVRRESFKSLAIIAGPESLGDLIRLLIDEKDGAVRNEAERTVVLVSQKIDEPSSRVGPILALLPSVDDSAARSSLLEVLGRIGDMSALPALRDELQSENPENQEAAILAFSAWPDAGPIEDLLNVVKTSHNETHKILALRGYIGLLRIRSDRPAKESIDLYMTAMEHATEISEKRMVLSGLSGMWSGAVEALNIIEVYLEDPSLKPEAEAAIIRLLDRIRDRSSERLKGMFSKGLGDTLNTILMSTDNERIREWIPGILNKGM